jgi:hypothetical protein
VMDVTEDRSGDGAPAQGVTAARKLKKPKPAPIEVPVPDVPYELCVWPEQCVACGTHPCPRHPSLTSLCTLLCTQVSGRHVQGLQARV